MLKTSNLLMYELRDYASPKAKLTHMLKKGEIRRICRGVYSTSSDDPRLPVASMILSPSYVSFETALALHQLIPERTHAIVSAGFRLKKEKHFDTPFGRYSFLYIPEEVFPMSLEPADERGHGFRLASKEKALCDTLYKIRGIKSMKAVEALLFEDLRMEREDVLGMDWPVLQSLVPLYHSSTLNSLMLWGGKNT